MPVGDMSLFSIIGPIMVGPSSSHTAGAVRLGQAARHLLGATPVRAKLELHGSFAETGRGHGTHEALIAGLLGLTPDDPQVPGARTLADRQGVWIEFHNVNLGSDAHPNSVRFTLADQQGKEIQVIGCSIGGGRVRITEVDGFQLELTLESATVVTVHKDVPGIVAQASSALARHGINIARLSLARRSRGDLAMMVIETDHDASAAAPEIAQVPGVLQIRALPAMV